jgi:hypothetical protein
MTKREKERKVFIALINRQLEPFGVTYDEVKDNPNWYMEYRTTEEAEREFMDWGVALIRKELRMSAQRAKMEMNWFILQWGITTAVTDGMPQKTPKTKSTEEK